MEEALLLMVEGAEVHHEMGEEHYVNGVPEEVVLANDLRIGLEELERTKKCSVD